MDPSKMTRPRSGRISVVGAGPGDPGLLTLRGLRALREADVVVIDGALSEAFDAHIPPKAERFSIGQRSSGFSPIEPGVVVAFMVDRARRGSHVVRLKTGDPLFFGTGADEVVQARNEGIVVVVIPGVSRITAGPALAGIPLIVRGIAGSVLILPGQLKPAIPRPTIAAIATPPQEPEPATAERRAGVVVRRRALMPPPVSPPLSPNLEATGIQGFAPVPATSRVSYGPQAPAAAPPPTSTAEGVSRDLLKARLNADPAGLEELALGPEDFAVDWNAVCAAAETIVFETVYHLESIRDGLTSGGRAPSEPVALISRGATVSQSVAIATVKTMVEEAQRHRLRMPLTVVVSEAVNLREHLMELERRPLFGLRIAITRASMPGQGSEDDELVRSLGARPIPMPIWQAQPVPGLGETLSELRSDLRRAAGVVIDSPEAAHALARGLEEAWLDWRIFPEDAAVVAVGEATRNTLEGRGLRAEMILDTEATAQNILGAMEIDGHGDHIAIVTHVGGSSRLAEDMKGRGVLPLIVPVYERTILRANLVTLRQALTRAQVDTVLFFSPADVDVCFEAWGAITASRLLRDVTVAAGNEATAIRLRQANITAAAVATQPGLEGMLDALAARKAESREAGSR
jgi:siroheme synthase/uroporphyrinogen-III synthase